MYIFRDFLDCFMCDGSEALLELGISSNLAATYVFFRKRPHPLQKAVTATQSFCAPISTLIPRRDKQFHHADGISAVTIGDQIIGSDGIPKAFTHLTAIWRPDH